MYTVFKVYFFSRDPLSIFYLCLPFVDLLGLFLFCIMSMNRSIRHVEVPPTSLPLLFNPLFCCPYVHRSFHFICSRIFGSFRFWLLGCTSCLGRVSRLLFTRHFHFHVLIQAWATGTQRSAYYLQCRDKKREGQGG